MTEKGRHQSRQVGRLLLEQGLVPDLMLTSPLTRARETATLACDMCSSGLRRRAMAMQPGRVSLARSEVGEV